MTDRSPFRDPEEVAQEIEQHQPPFHNVTFRLENFWCVSAERKFLYRPTGDLWPARSVDDVIARINGTTLASTWLSLNRSAQSVAWLPGHEEVIAGQIFVSGGWHAEPGANTYNLYRPPRRQEGDPAAAARWREHLRKLWCEADAHWIECWLAHRIQHPGTKCNHALVLGGAEGIGKDTAIEPLVHGVGPHNVAEVSPQDLLSQFNGYAKSVLLRVSESRDLGDTDKYKFYDHSKTLIAAPPEVLHCNEKFRQPYAVLNRTGVLITTNYKLAGLYWPADGRRHYYAWSDARKRDFDSAYFAALYDWYGAGGVWDVVAWLEQLDLSGWSPKAPPPKTAAYLAVAETHTAPEVGDLADLLAELGSPPVISGVELELAVRTSEGTFDDKTALTELISKPGAWSRRSPELLHRAGYERLDAAAFGCATVSRGRVYAIVDGARKPMTLWVSREASHSQIMDKLVAMGIHLK